MEQKKSFFKDALSDLSNTIAKIARRIATEAIAPEQPKAFYASRSVPLNENPGVHPIGIKEVIRRFIAHTITKRLSQDFLEIGSNKQLCLRQKRGN